MTTTIEDGTTASALLLEQAAHQNADGVLCLRRGDCGRAFHSFVSSLASLSKVRQHLVAHLPAPAEPPLHCSPASPPPPTTTTGATTTTSSSTCADSSSRPSKNCRAIAIPYLEDNGFSIYSNALVFSRRPRIGGQNNDIENNEDYASLLKRKQLSQVDTIAYCEAVTQFNLGLAYHQRGRHCGEDRTLLGALELYGQSLATLQSIETKAARESNDVRVLRLAVTNNRIHILNEMARYPAAQALVNQFLLQSVQTLSTTNGEDDADGQSSALCFLTRADIDNFLLNALVIRRFNTAPCA